MKSFETLQQFLEYIPNCIVCGKIMQLFINFTLPSVFNEKNIPHWTSERIHFQMELKNGLLVSRRNKNYNLVINQTKNEVITKIGFDQINNNFIIGRKSCGTCCFNIVSSSYELDYLDGKSKIINLIKIPKLRLVSEDIKYTMRRGKTIGIYKSYYSDDSSFVNIMFNYKKLDLDSFEFAKISNIKQLNKKIEMWKVFQ